MPARSPISLLRLPLLTTLLGCIGDAGALGLGKLSTRSALGEALVAEVEVITVGSEDLDSSCFHLRPSGNDGDLPWLKRATFRLQKGASTTVEIRSGRPLNDPVLHIGLYVACGHELRRDYILLLSPRGLDGDTEVGAVSEPAPLPVAASTQPDRPREPAAIKARFAIPPPGGLPRPSPPLGKMSRAPTPQNRPVAPYSGGAAILEPGLRMVAELNSLENGEGIANPLHREILRLEFRLTTAVQEMMASPLVLTQSWQMDGTLDDFLRRAGAAAPGGKVGESLPAVAAAPSPNPPSGAPTTKATGATGQQRAVSANAGGSQESSPLTLYGSVAAALLLVSGWLGRRLYRRWQTMTAEQEDELPSSAIDSSSDEDLNPVEDGSTSPRPDLAQVDVEAECPNGQQPVPLYLPVPVPDPLSKDIQVASMELGAGPTLELADIMLSFGRVNGAVQALQEYIDEHPDEALQPWLRLMDVYRQAGKRSEFESLVRDLNRHFNVEVQRWTEAQQEAIELSLADVVPEIPAAATLLPLFKPQTLEDFDHIREKLVACWSTPACMDYLQCLLHDTRGGQRSGFPMPVVEEILFLMELIKTRASEESSSEPSNFALDSLSPV